MKAFARALPVLIAFFFIHSCTVQQTSNPNLYKQWMLVEFTGYTKNQLIDHQAHIDLSPRKAPANQYIAYMGCNKMFFKARFFDKKVEISNVGSTMMYCENMQLEQDFAKMFPNLRYYEIHGHYLTFTDDQGRKMTFVAADWD